MTAKTIINAATPCSPRLLSKLIKLLVTCVPKNATFGPNNISAITDTASNKTPNSRNLLKYSEILEIHLSIYNLSRKIPNLSNAD